MEHKLACNFVTLSCNNSSSSLYRLYRSVFLFSSLSFSFLKEAKETLFKCLVVLALEH